MKKIIVYLMALAMLLSLAACSSETAGDGQTETITVVDHNGNTVAVPKNIERIAVCDIFPLPSVLSVFFDSAEKLVGIAPNSMSAAKNSLLSELYPGILNAETGYMTGSEVNIEELAALKPDIVFYSASNPTLGQTLNETGFCAVAISAEKWEYDALETIDEWVALLSQIFPENDKAEKVRKYGKEVYDFVRERVSEISDEEKKRVFFLFQYSDSMIMTSGKRFFGQWWADSVGAKNVGEELATSFSTAVNLEQVYTWNPDIILITNFTAAQPDDLYNNTVGNYDWSAISAVRNKRVYKMPLGMYRSYTAGIDTPVTLLWIAKTVYPDLFEDIDIIERTKEYYDDVFGIRLTDGQAEKIFKPVSDTALKGNN